MKINIESSHHHIQRYNTTHVMINDIEWALPLFLIPNIVTVTKPNVSFATLTIKDIAELLPYQPALILIGTGPTLCFAQPDLTAPLWDQRIGVECMTTKAACRTYNLLVNEGRLVLALLF